MRILNYPNIGGGGGGGGGGGREGARGGDGWANFNLPPTIFGLTLITQKR